MTTMAERSFVMIKPDGVAAGLTGEIISRIERRGLVIEALRKGVMSREAAEERAVRPAFGKGTRPRSTTPSTASARSSASWWTSSPPARW